MFQTFTGNPRRARQVNLSGRPTNPFASASSPAGGPQSAIASAQQERANRQQQREKLHASQRIQRLWRGHTSRRRTYKLWRQIWDEREDAGTSKQVAYSSPEESLLQLQRLLLFYQPKVDSKRLSWYGMRQMATNDVTPCSDGPWPKAYLRVVRACVAALKARAGEDENADGMMLTVLGFAARRTALDQPDAISYYETLTKLQDVPAEPLQNALVAPLQGSSEAYVGLAVLLAKPLEADIIALLRSAVDPQALEAAVTHLPERTLLTARSRLWLLGNMLCLASQSQNSTSMAFTTVIARLLGSLADDVDFEGPAVDLDNITFDNDVLTKVSSGLPLNSFLHEQITSLINQESIRNLLVRSTSSTGSGTNAQLLAGYALTLLRCCPRRADDIRMWLYLGPHRSSTEVAATHYFWQAAKDSVLFSTVRRQPRHIIQLVKNTDPSQGEKDDWTVILVFLELYTFLLKIMDDEEFMGSASYGRRNSAIPVSDVAELVTFLKNLGFTLYWNTSELNDTGDVTARDAGSLMGLGRHFNKGGPQEPIKAHETKPLAVAGLPGLTIDYLKGLVTGLLRAIYERDSRRHFLPNDHWLMTNRFDMTAFIPGVVTEEEKRNMVQGQDDEDRDPESDDDEPEYSAGRVRGYVNALRSQEARARAQRKASRKRYLESVAPRLEILQNMPFFIPFTTRVEIFRQFVELDQQNRRNGYVDPDLWRESMVGHMRGAGMMGREDPLARHHAKIRRKNEFADAFDQFYHLGESLKEPIQITFVDEFDIPEAGIDGGGVTKEFLTSVISQAFDPEDPNMELSFFVENDKHLLYPNPTAVEDVKQLRSAATPKALKDEIRDLLRQYEFLGRIIGKCLYEGILVDVSFAGFFLKKWALTGGVNSAPGETNYRPNINDLKELDEDLYKGLLAVKNAPAEDVESFGLTFTVDDLVGGGGMKKVLSRDLLLNGANTPVTGENRLIYIDRMARYRLQGQAHAQTTAFLKGLSALVQPSWLSMFNQSELQTLIGGAAASIDIADLRKNTLYGGTYVLGDDGQEHPSIKSFWKVMESLPDVDRRKVLKFVTSTPRGPLLGFSHLNPRFSIRDSGQDENRYPTTSTCVNLLKLPMYRSEGVLREKLLAAVNSGAGFDLS